MIKLGICKQLDIWGLKFEMRDKAKLWIAIPKVKIKVPVIYDKSFV